MAGLEFDESGGDEVEEATKVGDRSIDDFVDILIHLEPRKLLLMGLSEGKEVRVIILE
jgi:hypothetical protein